MDGMFLAARRTVCEPIRFDEDTFDGFHHCDLDFTLRAAEANFKLAACNDLMLLHYSKGSWERYAGIFMNAHSREANTIPADRQWTAWCATQVRTATREAMLGLLQSHLWSE